MERYMKIVLFFVLSMGMVFAAESSGQKDGVDLDKLFKQLDGVIANKKDDEKISEEKAAYEEDTKLKTDNQIRKHNEKAKNVFVYRAGKLGKTLEKLQKRYEKKGKIEVSTQRYSLFGDTKFAYVSQLELKEAIGKLEETKKVLDKLKNFELLLKQLRDFEIKTISRVLIIVEQEIMNLLDFGVRKIKPINVKKEVDAPILVKEDKRFNNIIEVGDITQERVMLKIVQ